MASLSRCLSEYRTKSKLKEGYQDALPRAAILRTRVETKRAELKLKNVESETIMVEKEIGNLLEATLGDYNDDYLNSNKDVELGTLSTLTSEGVLLGVFDGTFGSGKKNGALSGWNPFSWRFLPE